MGSNQFRIFKDSLSRDSLVAHRIAVSLGVQVGDGAVNGLVEDVWVGEGLVGEMMDLEVTPDDLDVVEFGGIFRQPLDDEPMGTFGQGRHRRLADMDRAVVEHDDDGLDTRAGLWAIELVEGLQMRDEVGAAFGAGGGDNQLALRPIERAHHGNFLRLPGRWYPQVRATLGPGTGEVGMCQCFALVREQEHDVTGFGLRFAQLEPHTDAIDGVGVLTPL